MEKQWKIQFWGTRGSIPRAGKDFLEYGGNTSCVSVNWSGGWVVFDAGSGLVDLGQIMGRESAPKLIHILFSHLHMDHILGFFGFGLFHDPEARIHLYGEPGAGISFRQRLEQVAAQPYWPLGLDDYQAQIQIHEVGPGQQFCLEETGTALRVSTLRGMHPGGSILYRLDQTTSSGPAAGVRESGAGDVAGIRKIRAGDVAGVQAIYTGSTVCGEATGPYSRSLVYALDCELDKAMSRELAAFASGTDLLVCDAHFIEEDLKTHQGWGHSSWQQGMALRQASGAARGVMMHFYPGYTDAFLRQQETELQALDGNCCFAKEGMEIRI